MFPLTFAISSAADLRFRCQITVLKCLNHLQSGLDDLLRSLNDDADKSRLLNPDDIILLELISIVPDSFI
jgi:hypothetical protein